MKIKHLEIWFAELPSIPDSHVQYGIRPVVIVSNDTANEHSPMVSIVPLTSQLKKSHLPTHVFLCGYGLSCNSIALCEQIITLDKRALKNRVGVIYGAFDRIAIHHAMAIQLDMAV